MTQENCKSSDKKSQEKNLKVSLLDDPAMMKELVEFVIQEILEAEFLEHIGAFPYERSEDRKDYRNGFKSRVLNTRVGKISLRLPQSRFTRFRSSLFERYQRSERAFILSMQEMILQGVSTRRVRKITEHLYGISFSRSMVSKLSQELDKEVKAWLNRKLEGKYPYLIVDAIYVKVRENNRVVSKAVNIIKGIHESGRREILNVSVSNSETDATWSDAFINLKRRGLTGVRLVVSDAHEGLRSAIDRHFQNCLWQRCIFHFKRNILGRVKKKYQREINFLLDDIYSSPTYEIALEKLARIVDNYSYKYPEVCRILEEQFEDTLSVYHIPMEHRRRLRTTNSLERLNEEIRRRIRVIRIFPNVQSCLRLISCICIEKSEEWETGRRYLNMESLKIDDSSQQKSPVATLLPTSAEAILEV